ncbi:protein kinase domain-containing protein (plasmid) [Rhizobium sp. CB3171]|uniref:helix-hairpin-helix domain-containing protein n=1 Tax=Rhizobium sp. CB3171 TaxID=3039157 RepID=UPI0024B05F74|nr:protein kinase domain-containing protein [Rhizobium sp. CB3171]WFU06746.1 protein kinase domain-containing protein [Rhizobium sp. CB3171]
MSTTVFGSDGKKLTLGTMLGKGGEGTVYHIHKAGDLAVKIYNPGKASERKAKILAMTSAALHKTTDIVAFPIDTVSDKNGTFMGFSMKKVAGFKNIHELYGPGSRRTEFPSADARFLVRSAFNLANAFAAIHNTGCVVGDVNHSGILVSNQAMVTLIDSDSFQFNKGPEVYRCTVGVPDYTPPELRGADFEKMVRTANHDNFGLAVLIFQLLFLGRHPFAGKHLGLGDIDIPTAIGDHRFAYSARRAETRMEPPPLTPALSDFGNEVSDAFESAFSKNGDRPGGRPNAASWVQILGKLEQGLVECSADKSHAYFRGGASCPWCRLEKSMGRNLFAAKISSTVSTLNIGDLIALINRPAPPSQPPAPESIIAVPSLTRSPAAAAASHGKQLTLFASVAGLLIGFLLANQLNGFWGTALVIASIIMMIRARRPGEEFRVELQAATAAWEEKKKIWEEHAGPAVFLKRKSHYLSLASAHAKLPEQERERLLELERKKRDLQFRSHMQGHLISRAKIGGIGQSRTVTLSSFGFDSAWDVKTRSVLAVPGIGPKKADALANWSSSVEKKFVFNSHIATDPQAINEVKTDIARQRADLEGELRRAPDELKELLDTASDLRRNPPPQLVEAYVRLKQVQMDIG